MIYFVTITNTNKSFNFSKYCLLFLQNIVLLLFCYQKGRGFISLDPFEEKKQINIDWTLHRDPQPLGQRYYNKP